MTHEEKQEILDEIRLLRSDVQPMIDIFKTLKFIGRWTGVIFAFLGSMTALALGIKSLFKK